MIYVLFLTLIIKQFLWIAFVPIWHFPDEQAHFAQIQNIVETRGKTINPLATTSREIYESEKLLRTLRDGAGNNQYTYHPEFNIAYTATKLGAYEKIINSYPAQYRHDRVIAEATGYPPLYYLFSSIFYQDLYMNDLLTRIYITRLANIFLFVAAAVVIWKIGKIIFPNNKLLQITYVLLVTFQPMYSFVFGGINSDNLYNLLFTIGIYLSLKIMREGLSSTVLFLMTITALLAQLTKPQGQLLIVIYSFPLAIALRPYLRKYSKIITGVLIICVVGVSLNYYKSVNQQSIPEIPILSNLRISLPDFAIFFRSSILDAYRKMLPWYWGVFRWLSLSFPRPVHRVINWTLFISIAGLIKYTVNWIKKKHIYPDIKITLFFVFASTIYFLCLTLFDYLFTQSYGYSFGLQGRYFFPLISAHMALVLIGIHTLIRNQKMDWVIKLLGFGIIILHHYVFFFVTNSYFKGSSILDFFIRASQYKPAFFKSPTLELLISSLIVSSAVFLWYYLRKQS